MNGIRRRDVIGCENNIPTGYKRIQYIQGRYGDDYSGSYFDIGLTVNSENRAYRIKITPVFAYRGVVFGMFNNDSEASIHTRLSILNNRDVEWDCYKGNGYGRLLYRIPSGVDYLNYEFGNNYIKDLDTDMTLVSGAIGNYTYNKSMYLFAANHYNNRIWGPCQHKIHEFEIIDNGITSRHYIPVKNENNVGGMFDLVERTFNPSVNANYPFICGPEL